MEPVIQISSGASKWDIRHKVWDYIEEKNLANFPRPVHNRIPNFKSATQACDRLAELQEFRSSQTVKVNPDRPQQHARFLTLEAQKTLLVPTPRLRTGLFNKITPPAGANKEQLRVCASSQGVKEFSVPVGLDAKVKVDLVVVGSVAVSEKGFRIGKGEGYADMEFGMMASMEAVSDSTVVVTVVHDCQVVNIPEELVESHDLTVDYILTPSRVIKTNCQSPKPTGIVWTKLDKEKLEKIPILKKLRDAEELAGKDVTLGASPAPPEPSTQGGRAKRQSRRRPNTRPEPERESKPDKAEQPEPKGRQRPTRARKESRGDEGAAKEGETRERGKERRRRRGTASEKGPEEGGGGGDTAAATTAAAPPRKLPPTVTTVYLGGIPAGLRVSELKSALRERDAAPLRLTWQGAQHRAFLDYSDPPTAEQALAALQDLSVNGHSLQAELAKSQRGGKRSGQSSRRPRPAAAAKNKAAPDVKGDTSEVTE